jgi:hypothetical protein
MNMKRKKCRILLADAGSRHFQIVEDIPEVSWYLYVFENNECIADHCQNDLETAMDQANRLYQVPHTAWKERI